MDQQAKLQWRCRRGSLELDVLLCRYLSACYGTASIEERQLFEQLLRLQDQDLYAYLFGDRQPLTVGMSRLVDKIRNFPAA